MHAVTVAHIPEEIKLIDTDIDIRKNILWSTRLTGKQIQRNLRFQNGVWFVFNYVVIISMWIFSSTSDHSNTEIQVFWPFTPGTTYSLNDNKVFRVLNYVAPIILVIGLLSQIIIWFFETNQPKKTRTKDKSLKIQLTEYEDDDVLDAVDAAEDKNCRIEGWHHAEDDCPGCRSQGSWHRHVYDESQASRAQSNFSLIISPLLNIWENFGDKNTAQT